MHNNINIIIKLLICNKTYLIYIFIFLKVILSCIINKFPFELLIIYNNVTYIYLE